MKKLSILALAPLFSACATHPASPAPIALQIPLSDTLRGACEVVPFPSEAEFTALKTVPETKAWAMKREVAHNGALGTCNMERAELVAAIDAANKAMNGIAK